MSLQIAYSDEKFGNYPTCYLKVWDLGYSYTSQTLRTSVAFYRDIEAATSVKDGEGNITEDRTHNYFQIESYNVPIQGEDMFFFSIPPDTLLDDPLIEGRQMVNGATLVYDFLQRKVFPDAIVVVNVT